MTYSLINPHLEGNFNNNFEGSTPMNAAKNVYNEISKYFNNNVPKYYFTLQNNEDKSYHHFEVREKKNGSQVNYNITSHKPTYKIDMDNFNAPLNKYIGGKHSGTLSKIAKRLKHEDSSSSDSDSSSSSSSDSDDWVRTKVSPIRLWWYDPSIYRIPRVIIPTLNIRPYVVIPYYRTFY